MQKHILKHKAVGEFNVWIRKQPRVESWQQLPGQVPTGFNFMSTSLDFSTNQDWLVVIITCNAYDFEIRPKVFESLNPIESDLKS